MNALLLSIQVPDITKRSPKTVEEISKWKGLLLVCVMWISKLECGIFVCLSILTCFLIASELRPWMLYYSVQLLDGILPPGSLNHLSYFVGALHIIRHFCTNFMFSFRNCMVRHTCCIHLNKAEKWASKLYAWIQSMNIADWDSVFFCSLHSIIHCFKFFLLLLVYDQVKMIKCNPSLIHWVGKKR